MSFLTRLVKTLPNLAVFMSSFTIVAIAIDRYITICRPTKPRVREGNLAMNLDSDLPT